MRGALEDGNDQTGGAIIESLKREPSVTPSRDSRQRDLTRAGGSDAAGADPLNCVTRNLPRVFEP